MKTKVKSDVMTNSTVNKDDLKPVVVGTRGN